MAQELINFGKPPLGIGGDTFITGFEKCNANFTELYSSMKKVSINSTVMRYQNLVGLYSASSATKGAIVIHLPKTKANPSTMLSLRVSGYSYSADQGSWGLTLGGYAYREGRWINTSAAITGRAPFSTVRFGMASDHRVIILGDVDSAWSHPVVTVDEMTAHYNGMNEWETGWSIAVETDISAYTISGTPTVYGTNRVQSAEKLTTARTIGGVSFDGTANINLPGVNTAGNQSTTGNAATATKLQTERSINGTKFNGSADITTARWGNARTITLSGSATGSVSINGAENVTLNISPRRANATSTLATAFRSTTKGDTESGNYISVVRSEVAISEVATAYSAGLAIGTSDTHGYISFDYNTANVFVGGGNANKLNWQKKLAFTDSWSAMTTAEAEVGTGTTNRLITAAVLKSAIQTHSPTPASFNGSNTGLVPARTTTTTTRYLREDGTWTVPPNTTYASMSTAEAQAGTAATARLITAANLKTAIVTHAPIQHLGSQAVKAVNYNAQSISENLTIPGDVNALSVGPLSIDSGKTVTVTSGATWTIV